jgi:hypothetical protein
MRKILLGLAIIVISFGIAFAAMQWLLPNPAGTRRPVLVETPPLPPAVGQSVVVAPVAIAVDAIRQSIEAATPHDMSGKGDKNPLSQLLKNADVGWTVKRGPFAVTGTPQGLTISTAFTGTFRATGKLGTEVGNITGALGNLLGENVGKQVQSLTGQTIDQRADWRGNVVMTSRPALTPAWRLDPNLAAKVAIGNANLSISGVRISITNDVKGLVDGQVAQQIAALQARIRNDPMLEGIARREWAKMCRSIPLGNAGAGLPNLWLEMRPVKAFAGQPRVDASAVTLPIGVAAETRIVPAETRPECPFPAQLEIIPQVDDGRVNIGLPIDVPFTDVNKLLEARLKGRTFPEQPGAFAATVQRATVAASGERLLITLLVRATERKSFFGLGADATVHVWGKPVLDRERQLLRLADITLAVESESAFGLLDAAARAAIPYFQSSLEQNAVIDLKPLLASTRENIASVLAEYRTVSDDVRVDAAVNEVRLVGIAFDARTLRLIAEVDGTAKVAITGLPR